MANVPIEEFDQLPRERLLEVARKSAADARRYAKESGDRRVEAKQFRTRAELAESALHQLALEVIRRFGPKEEENDHE